MGDYFTLVPQSVENISPGSTEYHTASSSRVVSPLENPESAAEPSETDDPLDEHCEDDTAVDGKVAQDVKVHFQNLDQDIALPNQQRLEQNVEQLMNIGGAIQVFRRDSRIRDLAASPPTPTPIAIPQPRRDSGPRPKLFIEDTPSPPFSCREFIPRPPTPYRPRAPRRSFSTSEAYSPPTSSPFGSPPILNFHPIQPQTQSQPQTPPPTSSPFGSPPTLNFHSITPQIQPHTPPQPQPQAQNLDLEALKAALKVIRTQLTLLDVGIKTNIAEQLKLIPPSPTSDPNGPIDVLDQGSLPSFKVDEDEKMDRGVSKALLDSVKVCCVVERGLEGVIGVLEKVGKDEKGKERSWAGEEGERKERVGGEKKKEGDLMSACLEKSKVVRREMRSALKGIEGVVGFDGAQK